MIGSRGATQPEIQRRQALDCRNSRALGIGRGERSVAHALPVPASTVNGRTTWFSTGIAILLNLTDRASTTAFDVVSSRDGRCSAYHALPGPSGHGGGQRGRCGVTSPGQHRATWSVRGRTSLSASDGVDILVNYTKVATLSSACPGQRRPGTPLAEFRPAWTWTRLPAGNSRSASLVAAMGASGMSACVPSRTCGPGSKPVAKRRAERVTAPDSRRARATVADWRSQPYTLKWSCVHITNSSM